MSNSSPSLPLSRRITGVCPPAQAYATARLLHGSVAPVWLAVIEEPRQAPEFLEDVLLQLHRLAPGLKVDAQVFPESQADSRDMREAFIAASDRVAVLSRLRGRRGPAPAADERLLLVTSPAALLQAVPAPEDFSARETTLKRGQSQPFQALLDLLRSYDYDAEAVCEAPGQYAVRGGIIDVYPVSAHHPVRLDFFGDTLEEIKVLDPVTQRSGEAVGEVTLSAAPQIHAARATASLLDHLPAASDLVLLEPRDLEEAFDLLGSEARVATAAASHAGGPALPHLGSLAGRCARLLGVGDLDVASGVFPDNVEGETWDTEPLSHHRSMAGDDLLAHDRLEAEESARADFLTKVSRWAAEGYDVEFIVSGDGERERLKELIEESGKFAGRAPRFVRGHANEGFRVTESRGTDGIPRGYIAVTETEIFGRKRQRRSVSKRAVAATSAVDQLLDFAELAEGDFVVHLQHGVAVYRGITRIETSDGQREVISLEFDDKVTLHVPLQESHLVSRYVGLGRTRPRLGKVGSGRWEKVRAAAERATIDLAADLLRIQAQREAQPGHAFAADNTWQREFEAAFPFTETPDQAKAIVAAKQDMESTRPMDRLVCGDVGFGKTEVALRAAFKAVMGGKQVAVLVPTTILAQQHLATFRERTAGYPVAVEMLSRFRTRKEQQATIAALAEGKIDIVIGTHRLVQADVQFRDLGLVIIDEEQRFGVKHKEVFKRWRAHVDVLSMSATPIPRTLYLALTGARDLSTIETAPVNRLPIHTVVKSYDEKLVAEAIRHEVRRGGQVFYLHNRVATIDLVASRLRELVPDVVVGVGHGKMDEDELEKLMTEFVAGRHQVLVCTTIIESGLDIPNCNTIIIEGADRFGLSQLYQLRGRVGRFRHQAYAYLLLHRHARVVDLARQRLSALRQHNQLGAGFRIAMRDLELRGAGNLLGAEQSGHIVGVGFELYCQLLRQSVARLKGDKEAARIRAAVRLDFVFVGEGASEAAEGAAAGTEPNGSYQALRQAEREGAEVRKIQARLPAAYIAETRLRIDFYRRLAMAQSPKQVKEIEQELRDRFGRFGEEVRTLLLVTEIRTRAEQKNLLSVETGGNLLKCLRNTGSRDDYIQLSHRFPRLTAPTPLARLREILTFLQNLPST